MLIMPDRGPFRQRMKQYRSRVAPRPCFQATDQTRLSELPSDRRSGL